MLEFSFMMIITIVVVRPRGLGGRAGRGDERGTPQGWRRDDLFVGRDEPSRLEPIGMRGPLDRGLARLETAWDRDHGRALPEPLRAPGGRVPGPRLNSVGDPAPTRPRDARVQSRSPG